MPSRCALRALIVLLPLFAATPARAVETTAQLERPAVGDARLPGLSVQGASFEVVPVLTPKGRRAGVRIRGRYESSGAELWLGEPPGRRLLGAGDEKRAFDFYLSLTAERSVLEFRARDAASGKETRERFLLTYPNWAEWKAEYAFVQSPLAVSGFWLTAGAASITYAETASASFSGYTPRIGVAFDVFVIDYPNWKLDGELNWTPLRLGSSLDGTAGGAQFLTADLGFSRAITDLNQRWRLELGLGVLLRTMDVDGGAYGIRRLVSPFIGVTVLRAVSKRTALLLGGAIAPLGSSVTSFGENEISGSLGVRWLNRARTRGTRVDLKLTRDELVLGVNHAFSISTAALTVGFPL
jgi:hypothetical protein